MAKDAYSQSPRITRVAPVPGSVPGNGLVTVNWTCPDCTEPYQLQIKVPGDEWQDLGCVTTATSQTTVQTEASALYRVATVRGYSGRNDRTPPSQITNLTATIVNCNQINLSWQAATDNTGVKAYNIMRNGVILASVAAPVTTYANVNLLPLTNYTYTVSAVDGAYNDSPASSPLTVNTPGCPCFFNITADAVPSAGGLIVGAGAINCGSNLIITALPNVGYSFLNWTENGTNVSSSSTYALTADGNRNLTANFINSSLGQFRWVSSAHGSMPGQEAFVNGVAADHRGNIISVGQWRGTIDLGDGIVRSSTGGNVGLDIFIVKYNAQGQFLWGKSIGGSDHDQGYAVAVDSADNIIVVGGFTTHQSSPTIDFGGGPISGHGIQDIFVVKYSSSGSFVWLKNFGSPFSDYGYAVAADTNDNIFVGGVFTGYIDFGNGTGQLNAAGAGGYDCFLAKLNSSGIAQWSKRFGGSGGDVLKSITVDRTGDVAVAGYYSGTADFGGGGQSAPGANAGFLAKYSGVNGTYRWARTFGSASSAYAYGVATDPNNGDVLVSGSFGSGTDFGGGAVATDGGKGIFIARYSASSGSYLWARTYGGSYNNVDIGYAMAIDASGRIALTGRIQSSVNFGGGWFWGGGLPNLFVLSLNSTGDYRWARRCDNTMSTSYAQSACLDLSGNIIAAGTFGGSVDFSGTAASGSVVSGSGSSQAAFTVSYGP